MTAVLAYLNPLWMSAFDPLRWALYRATARCSRSMIFWWMVLLLGVGLSVLAGAVADQAQRRQLAALWQPTPQARSATAPRAAASVQNDFTSVLRRSRSPQRLATEVNRLVSEEGMTLLEMGITEHASSESELGRIELNLAVRGDYLSFKRLMKRLTESYDQDLSFHVLRQRRATAPEGAVDTSLGLSFWTPPLPATTSAR